MREQCPKCKANGYDTSKDNLQRYEDGHAHCYACGYHIFSNSIEAMIEKVAPAVPKQVTLPQDAIPEIDFRALTWLANYEITTEEVSKYRMLWSRKHKLLIFPIYSAAPQHGLLAWQGRAFGGEGPKYWTEGPIHEIIVPLNHEFQSKAKAVVLVEDYISAIKVARHHTAVCMFGSSMTSTWIRRMQIITDTLYFWLDNDKAKEAVKLAKIATMLNFKVKVIVTNNDPKRYTDEEINQAITG